MTKGNGNQVETTAQAHAITSGYGSQPYRVCAIANKSTTRCRDSLFKSAGMVVVTALQAAIAAWSGNFCLAFCIFAEQSQYESG
jgi:hypothetical protein